MTINVPVTKDGLEKIVTFALKDLLEKVVILLKVVLVILVIMEYVHLIHLMSINVLVKKNGPEEIATFVHKDGLDKIVILIVHLIQMEGLLMEYATFS